MKSDEPKPEMNLSIEEQKLAFKQYFDSFWGNEGFPYLSASRGWYVGFIYSHGDVPEWLEFDEEEFIKWQTERKASVCGRVKRERKENT